MSFYDKSACCGAPICEMGEVEENTDYFLCTDCVFPCEISTREDESVE